MLSKTQSILNYSPIGHRGYVTFERSEGDVDRIVEIDEVAWKDMGTPTIITVTIQPGDHLNPEQE